MKFIPAGPRRYAHQRRMLRRIIETRGVCALLADPGTGKGHPLDERIPTPEGWRTVGELEVGDTVFGSDGAPTAVTGIYERGHLPVYRVTFRDGASVRVDADHLWEVHTISRGRTSTKVLDTASLLREPRPGRYFVRQIGAQFPERELPVDPYLLGGLIADGSLAGNGVQWTKGEMSVVQEMRRAAARGGYGFTERKSWTVPRWGLIGVARDLDALGLRVRSSEKHVPVAYLVASESQRRALLAGLYDGDGSIRAERGTARYTTSSERLARDVLQLHWSLGEGATLQRAKHDRGDYWIVNLHRGHDPFRASAWRGRFTGSTRELRRSISKIEQDGVAPVRCIRVAAEDSLYLARDFILTHNTAPTLDYLSLLALKAQPGPDGVQEARALMVSPKAAVDNWIIQAETYVHNSVNIWAEALGGSTRQKALTIANRGPAGPIPRGKMTARARRDAERRALHSGLAELTYVRGGTLSDGPGGLPGPRLILLSMNYDALARRDVVRGSRTIADVLLEAIERFQPHIVVADEMHKLKGPSSNTSRLMARIGAAVPRRVGLTGTVMPHSPMDVFAQWRFLAPTDFGELDLRTRERKRATFTGFQRRYGVLGGYMGREVVSYRNLDEMQAIMAERSIVVRKEDALDLPPTTDTVVPVTLSGREAKAYAEMKRDLAARLDTGTLTASNRLTQMLRLRQITAGHLPDGSGGVTTLGDSKVRMIQSIVHDTLEGEDRVLVLGLFRHELDRLADVLARPGTAVLRIDGTTPDDARLAIRRRFGDRERHPERIVLVAQVQTVSLSINEFVTASNAVFASLSQRRDEIVQARDRLNRIGQTKPMTFWYALARGTIDEVIYRSLQARTDLEAAVLRHVQDREGSS